MGAFKEPHGGKLVDLYLEENAAESEKRLANEYLSWDLTERQIADLELLLNGAFSPLRGYQTQSEYNGVLRDLSLPSGVLWPLPIVLDVSSEFAQFIEQGQDIALRDTEGVLVATMTAEDIWVADKDVEARALFGSADERYFGVRRLNRERNPVYLGGQVRGVQPPTHYDFKLLRDSPLELRGRFRKLGWRKVVAYQPPGVMHRAEQDLGGRVARLCEASLLLQPAVGAPHPGALDRFTRVRCLEHVADTYPELTTMLSILNLTHRFAGPRDVLLNAIVRKNYGCTHFVVEAGQGDFNVLNGEAPHFDLNKTRAVLANCEPELDISLVHFGEMVYAEERAQFLQKSELKPEERVSSLDGEELKRRLGEGLDVADWFSFPQVITELGRAYPSRDRQGFTVFFTGLSGSGKSTVANALLVKLRELGSRPVTLLDGDVVRKHLSSELGFSKEHRNLNILRTGYVATEITKNGGIAICAPIAPYRETRRQVREMIEPHGGFLEIHVATPLDVCEKRDRKGLYARARAGVIKEFTGISDPYEEPESPDVKVDTSELTAELAAHRILIKLEASGYVK